MDIEEFYDEDERRRQSDEVELGTDWHDVAGIRYELSWIADTGELYLMREPVGGTVVDPFGDVYSTSFSDKELSVATIGWIPDQERLEQILTGWQDAMADRDSVTWLANRLSAAGVPRRPPALGTTT